MPPGWFCTGSFARFYLPFSALLHRSCHHRLPPFLILPACVPVGFVHRRSACTVSRLGFSACRSGFCLTACSYLLPVTCSLDFLDCVLHHLLPALLPAVYLPHHLFCLPARFYRTTCTCCRATTCLPPPAAVTVLDRSFCTCGYAFSPFGFCLLRHHLSPAPALCFCTATVHSPPPFCHRLLGSLDTALGSAGLPATTCLPTCTTCTCVLRVVLPAIPFWFSFCCTAAVHRFSATARAVLHRLGFPAWVYLRALHHLFCVFLPPACCLPAYTVSGLLLPAYHFLLPFSLPAPTCIHLPAISTWSFWFSTFYRSLPFRFWIPFLPFYRFVLPGFSGYHRFVEQLVCRSRSGFCTPPLFYRACVPAVHCRSAYRSPFAVCFLYAFVSFLPATPPAPACRTCLPADSAVTAWTCLFVLPVTVLLFYTVHCAVRFVLISLLVRSTSPPPPFSIPLILPPAHHWILPLPHHTVLPFYCYCVLPFLCLRSLFWTCACHVLPGYCHVFSTIPLPALFLPPAFTSTCLRIFWMPFRITTCPCTCLPACHVAAAFSPGLLPKPPAALRIWFLVPAVGLPRCRTLPTGFCLPPGFYLPFWIRSSGSTAVPAACGFVGLPPFWEHCHYLPFRFLPFWFLPAPAVYRDTAPAFCIPGHLCVPALVPAAPRIFCQHRFVLLDSAFFSGSADGSFPHCLDAGSPHLGSGSAPCLAPQFVRNTSLVLYHLACHFTYTVLHGLHYYRLVLLTCVFTPPRFGFLPPAVPDAHRSSARFMPPAAGSFSGYACRRHLARSLDAPAWTLLLYRLGSSPPFPAIPPPPACCYCRSWVLLQYCCWFRFHWIQFCCLPPPAYLHRTLTCCLPFWFCLPPRLPHLLAISLDSACHSAPPARLHTCLRFVLVLVRSAVCLPRGFNTCCLVHKPARSPYLRTAGPARHLQPGYCTAPPAPGFLRAPPYTALVCTVWFCLRFCRFFLPGFLVYCVLLPTAVLYRYSPVAALPPAPLLRFLYSTIPVHLRSWDAYHLCGFCLSGFVLTWFLAVTSAFSWIHRLPATITTYPPPGSTVTTTYLPPFCSAILVRTATATAARACTPARRSAATPAAAAIP